MRQFEDRPAKREAEKPFPHNTNYLVRSNGEIIGSRGKPLRPCVMKRGGYLGVSLWQNNKGKTWPIHQIVAITFHGERPTPKHHAAHNDGNKNNNFADNISWKTRIENEADKKIHGTSNCGERNGSAKITEREVKEIRGYIAIGVSIPILASAFGLKQTHVYSIASRRIWRHV